MVRLRRNMHACTHTHARTHTHACTHARMHSVATHDAKPFTFATWRFLDSTYDISHKCFQGEAAVALCLHTAALHKPMLPSPLTLSLGSYLLWGLTLHGMSLCMMCLHRSCWMRRTTSWVSWRRNTRPTKHPRAQMH